MAWSKAMTEAELAYIEKYFNKMSATQIAKKLGRSRRGVETRIKQLQANKEAASRARARTREMPEDLNAPQDELRELRLARSVLRTQLQECKDPRVLPKISMEFREVLQRISDLEKPALKVSLNRRVQGFEAEQKVPKLRRA